MNTWVQVNRRWPDRVGLFCLDARRLSQVGLSFPQIASEKDADVLAELIVMALVSEHPELKGGVLFCMSFTPHSMQAEFLYSHHSLPKCDIAQEPKKFRFMSDERYDDNGQVWYEPRALEASHEPE